MNGHRPVLIVGLPRSGTTWVGEVFSTAKDTLYLLEPDNEKTSPLAWLCKDELHRFPYLTAKDDSIPYQQLWRTILGGRSQFWHVNDALRLILRQRAFELEAGIGNRSGYCYIDSNLHKVGEARTRAYRVEDHTFMAFLARQLLTKVYHPTSAHRLMVKSVHASLSVEWIAHHFPVKVIFVLRNPYSLYTSYKRMRMPDGFRNLLFQKTLQRDMLQYIPQQRRTFMIEQYEQIVFQIMLMYKIIESQLPAHPEWTLISHDRLCMAPHDGYNRLFGILQLAWSRHTDEKIDSLNETGKGFAPKRISNQQPFKWKKEISDSEQSNIRRWVDSFDLHHFFKQYVDLE